MKSNSKFIIKTVSFSFLILSCTYAMSTQKKGSNCLDINSSVSTYKAIPKAQGVSITKIDCYFEPIIDDERKVLESWMINENFVTQNNEDQKKIENWMLDTNFWELKESTTIEEPAQLENWMIDLFNQNIEKAHLFDGFVEKDWMEKHSFYIL